MHTTRLYRTKNKTFSPRKTRVDETGISAAMWNESYRRSFPQATTPTVWGLRSGTTGNVTRLAPSRDAARSVRKPGETVVAIWA